MSVTHKFVVAIPDGDDPNVVRSSNWNDTHDGALEKATGVVDFGSTEGACFGTVDIAATWVAADSVIVASLGDATADHDYEDGLLEQITVLVSAKSAGVGFTVTAHAPNGTWGQYSINCVGL